MRLSDRMAKGNGLQTRLLRVRISPESPFN
jgi:hypothetical protein